MRWYADDGNAEVEYECDTAREAAREYVRDGDWGDPDEGIEATTWIDVRVADADAVDRAREGDGLWVWGTGEPALPAVRDEPDQDWDDAPDDVQECVEPEDRGDCWLVSLAPDAADRDDLERDPAVVGYYLSEPGPEDDLWEWHAVRLDPAEPPCDGEHEHTWTAPHHLVGGCRQNPGCWGHGGGVVIHEVCPYCGCERVTDTWATRMDTGQQGLRSIEYRQDAYPLHDYAVVDEAGVVLTTWADARTLGSRLAERGDALVDQHRGARWLATASGVEVGDRIDEDGNVLEADDHG